MTDQRREAPEAEPFYEAYARACEEFGVAPLPELDMLASRS